MVIKKLWPMQETCWLSRFTHLIILSPITAARNCTAPHFLDTKMAVKTEQPRLLLLLQQRSAEPTTGSRTPLGSGNPGQSGSACACTRRPETAQVGHRRHDSHGNRIGPPPLL